MSADEVLRDALDEWQRGINTQDPRQVAAVFAVDAIFQGLRPYSVGRQGIVEYYDSQPVGMTVSYRIAESRRPSPDVVVGYVHADFAFPDRPSIAATIGVVLERGVDGWQIGYYQASRIDG